MVDGKELKKCKYCSKEVKDVYWKNICQDCANKLSYWKRLGKEGRFKWFLKNDKAKCELLSDVGSSIADIYDELIKGKSKQEINKLSSIFRKIKDITDKLKREGK